MAQYHVTLNGQGYVLDLDRYRKRIREPFASKQATASESFSAGDLRGPEQLFTVSDWSGGEGYVQQNDANPARWRQGSGLDGAATVGGLRLGPRALSSFATGNGLARPLGVYTGKLIVADGVGNLYTWDGTTFVNFGTAAAIGGVVNCMDVFLGSAYFGNASNGKLSKWDGTTFTAAAATASGPIYTLRTHYRQAAQYLYVGCLGAGSGGTGRIYYWDGAVLSAGQFDCEENTVVASFVLSGRCYFVAQDGSNQRWGIYSVDNGGSGGLWTAHARLTGGYGQVAAVYRGVAYIGDAVGGRIWAFDGAQTVTLARDLSAGGTAYTGLLRGMAVWRGALWVAITDGAGIGLLRYDGAGWSRPVTGITTSTASDGLVPHAGDLWVGATAGSSVTWRVSGSTYAASGTLDSGLIAFGLPGVSKLLKSVTLVCAAIVSPQTIKVEYQLEDTGAWTTLGTLSTVGATTATYTFAANTTCRQVAFRLTLTGTAGASVSPTLYQVQVRYAPRPAILREWELAVRLEGTAAVPLVTLDGTTEPSTGPTLTAALWTAAAASGPVTLLDLDGASYSVYVDDIREEMGKLSQRGGYQRLGIVKLVEAA